MSQMYRMPKSFDLEYKSSQTKAQNQIVLDFLTYHQDEVLFARMLYHLQYDVQSKLILNIKKVQIDFSLHYQCRFTKAKYLITGSMKAIAIMESKHFNVSEEMLLGDKTVKTKHYWSNAMNSFTFIEMANSLMELSAQQKKLGGAVSI